MRPRLPVPNVVKNRLMLLVWNVNFSLIVWSPSVPNLIRSHVRLLFVPRLLYFVRSLSNCTNTALQWLIISLSSFFLSLPARLSIESVFVASSSNSLIAVCNVTTSWETSSNSADAPLPMAQSALSYSAMSSRKTTHRLYIRSKRMRQQQPSRRLTHRSRQRTWPRLLDIPSTTLTLRRHSAR